MPNSEPIALQAGPVSLFFDSGDLRYLRVAGHEIVRRLYVAVRDQNWSTVPAVLSNVRIEQSARTFNIQYDVEHTEEGILFGWHGAIEGHADGTIRFSMAGMARSSFLRNRIGICVLHPMSCAGAVCVVEHVDGTREPKAFPVSISPHQPFRNMRSIVHQVAGDLWAEVRMAGDVFEMEDQRNWTDASFKTYSTPLDLPYPVEITAGTKIEQQVTIALSGGIPADSGGDTDPTLTLGAPSGRRLPRLGLGLAGHGLPLAPAELANLRMLNLAHLRVDLLLADPEYPAALRRAVSEADELGVELETAIFLSRDGMGDLMALAELVAALRPPVYTWLVFHEAERTTAGRWVRLAREYLAHLTPSARFGAGTNAYFVHLNREGPSLADMDIISYSINPQVHAFDDASLMESLAAQATTVESARMFCDDRPISISPVTLRPRFNPDATAVPADNAEGLSAKADPRQRTLFAAGWTLGSLKYLGESSVHSITYYETTGACGVMENGELFPVFHLLAEVGSIAGGEIIPCVSSNTLAVDGLALIQDGAIRVLIANLSATSQTIRIHGLAGNVYLRTLDSSTLQETRFVPTALRDQRGALLEGLAGELTMALSPHAIACIDSAPDAATRV